VYESVALLAWAASLASPLLKTSLTDEGVVWAAAITVDIKMSARRQNDFIPSIFHLQRVSHKPTSKEFTSSKC
jgi:hypothetical protein